MPRRHTADALARIETDELLDLYEHAPCGYLSLEPNGLLARVNATFLEWTGYAVDELQGRHFHDLLNIAGKIYYETHFAPLLRLQGACNEVALDMIAKDGSRLPFLVNATERRDAEGNAVSIRITVFNATDRRRYEGELLSASLALAHANKELSDLNGELRAFYESLPVGIFRTDATGAVVQASRRFCALLGVETAEDWLSAIEPEDRMTIAPQWDQAIRDGATFATRFRIAGPDARQIEMKAIPVNGPGHGASVFVGVAEDVTEKVEAETQKRQIDRAVAVRQLTGGLAHNLNGLLTVIMGNLDILQEDLAHQPQLGPVLDTSMVAAQKAATLVRRLLLYSGYTFARLDNLAIAPCLRGVAVELAGQIGPDHRLTCDFQAFGAVIGLEANMLKEAIREMVFNAVAAMPDGGEIRLSTRLAMQEGSDDRREIVIEVSDHGTGMDEGTLAMAREPFFTTREVGSGMGLGLSLIDGTARIAGGALTLRSDHSNGTTVALHLPLVN
jgi:PAS domain S-box-containing protein